MNLTQLEARFSEAKTYLNNLTNRFQLVTQAEGRPLGPGERAALDAATQELHTIKASMDRWRGDASMRDAIASVTSGMTPSGSHGASMRSGSLGAQFVSDPAYREFIQKGGHHSSGAWSSPPVELQGLTLTEDPASGGALVRPHVLPGIVELPTKKIQVADLFAIAQTDSNSITFMRETLFTNSAAAVAEGATKPESTLSFEAKTSPTIKIAHWIPVTSEILEDLGGTASYIDRRLRHGVELALDDSIVNGSGVGANLEGILAKAGIAAPVARLAETNAEAIAKQIAAIEAATLLDVDAIILHPTNWLATLLLKTTDGAYVGNGPFQPFQPPSLWGRTVVVSPVIAAGTALVGCFKSAAGLFFRNGMKLQASNSHASFFIENKVALLAEVRVNLVVSREAAFGLVTNLTA